jgi:hypothetical protein
VGERPVRATITIKIICVHLRMFGLDRRGGVVVGERLGGPKRSWLEGASHERVGRTGQLVAL